MKNLILQAFADSAAPTGVTAADAGQPAEAAAASAAPAETEEQGSAPADKTAAFEELIRGEYREEFSRRVKNIIDRRFAREKRAEQQAEPPTAEEPKREAQDKAYLQLLREADAAKAVYPDLELATEAKNPAFVRMLRAGLPVQAAYEAAHHEDLLRGAMRYTAAAVAREVSESICSGADRPRENGTGGAAAQTRYNLQSMDRAGRRALIARARAGEKIVL